MTEPHWYDLIALDALEPNDVTAVTLGRRRLAVYDGTAGISGRGGRCAHPRAGLFGGGFYGESTE